MGDVIVQLGGTEVKQMKDLLLALSKFEVGAAVKLDYFRMGSKREASLRLSEVPLQAQSFSRGN